MKTQALVVADDPVYQTWLRQVAGTTLEVTLVPAAGTAEEVVARIEAQPRFDIIFCEIDSRSLSERATLIERMLERHWQTPVVGLGAEDNPEWVLAAMRAGARDFFVLGRDDETLSVQIGRLLRRTGNAAAGPAGAGRSGKLYAVLAGHPHESIAFLGEHMALALVEAAQAGERVVLVDLATPAGAAAIFLNMKQTYSVLDAINDAHRCDDTLVDTAFPRHSSGLYVLSLPEDLLGQPAFDLEQLSRLLQVLTGLFGYMVVTLDGHLPLPALAGIANRADRLLVLSDQSILRSRLNKHLLRAMRLEGCPLDRAGLVVDDYRRRLGLEPNNLAELFDLPLFATLQTEEPHRVVSMNSGEPLYTLARKDSYCSGVRKLVAALKAGQAAVPGGSHGLFSRLRG